MPTIGAAKSRLVGAEAEPEVEAGLPSPPIYQGKQVGFILRTQTGLRPLYLSPGHLITLEESRAITLGCVTKSRVPQPWRQADQLTRRLKTAALRAEPR
ncbi:MAG: endonuclease V [Deltaproteobacteria bacterium]|nr:endonuclease V [Deltaproteobacteria bacterium]